VGGLTRNRNAQGVTSVSDVGGGQREEEGCCIERATKSDYVHNQDE
jgi:hypothetical protein